MYRIRPVFVVLFFSSGLLLYLFFRLSCAGITCLDAREFKGYVRQAVLQQENGVYRALYAKREESLVVESVDEPDVRSAANRMGVYVSDIEGLYETIRAPYPGSISKTVVCSQTYKPHIEYRTDADNPTVFAEGDISYNDAFGVCDAAETGGRAQVYMVYCPGRKKLLSLRRIIRTPGGSFSPNKLRISCR